MKEVLYYLEKNSQESLLVALVKEMSALFFISWTFLNSPFHPAICHRKPRVVWSSTPSSLILVLAQKFIYCMTFIFMGLHFLSPALSSLALVRFNSNERLLLISMNSFA